MNVALTMLREKFGRDSSPEQGGTIPAFDPAHYHARPQEK